MIDRPKKEEYSSYFDLYIKKIPDVDILKYMEEQTNEFDELFSELTEGDSLFVYEEGKWSIKEVIGHIVDTEWIFGVRALRFARRDKIELPQFDENEFVRNANFNDQPLDNLIEQFRAIRLSNLLLFDSFSEEMLTLQGNAAGNRMSVRTIPFVLAGHVKHHMDVIKERYMSKLL